MVFKLDPEQREEQGQLVERYLTALGYEDHKTWNAITKKELLCNYILAKVRDTKTYQYHAHDCQNLNPTFEPIPTPYQVAVAEHMATAPQPLAEYVRGRLPEGELTSSNNPFGYFYIAWQYTSEGYDFWHSINSKDWSKAIASEFWRSRTAPTERPKGVIGQWYTMTSDFIGNFPPENREAGYTWKCKSLDANNEPEIDFTPIGYKESYRLATPEEIKSAIQEMHPNEDLEQGAKEFGEMFGEMFEGAVQFEKPEHPEEYDFVNPKHYQEFSVEVIDMMAAIWGKEATATHCEMCAFKYKLRAGSKPDQPIERDLEKAAWYLSKAKELRDA